MLCPVCLSMGLQGIEGTVQVGGTVYCPQHGVEAFTQTNLRTVGRGPRPQVFSPPTPSTPPTPAEPQAAPAPS